MTLRELENSETSWVAPICPTSRIAKNMEDLFDRQVVRVDVPLTWKDKTVELNFWAVAGTEALVFIGPPDWLPIYIYKVPLFCFDYEHLAGILLNCMPHQWAGGSDEFDGEFAESIDAMFERLHALTSPPPPTSPSSPVLSFTTTLDLI